MTHVLQLWLRQHAAAYRRPCWQAIWTDPSGQYHSTCSSCVSMWWPRDSDVVATGHHIAIWWPPHIIWWLPDKKIFSAVVPAGLRKFSCNGRVGDAFHISRSLMQWFKMTMFVVICIELSGIMSHLYSLFASICIFFLWLKCLDLYCKLVFEIIRNLQTRMPLLTIHQYAKTKAAIIFLMQ